MKEQPSIWSSKQFKPPKGVPNIPGKIRPAVSSDWTEEIERLEKFFARAVLPTSTFKLNAWTTTSDLSFCIKSGMDYVKSNNGNPTFYPYLEELLEIELMLLPEHEREARKVALTPTPIPPVKKRVKRIKRIKAIPAADDTFVY